VATATVAPTLTPAVTTPLPVTTTEDDEEEEEEDNRVAKQLKLPDLGGLNILGNLFGGNSGSSGGISIVKLEISNY
jgi:hypothetical protein